MDSIYCNIRDREDTEDLIVRAKLKMYISGKVEDNKAYITNITKGITGDIELNSEHLFDLNSVEGTRLHQILSANKLILTTHLFGRMEVEVYGISISDYRIVINIRGSLTWRKDGTFAWAGNPALKEN